VTTLHGTDITLVGQEAGFFAITRFSIQRSDAVTAVSQFLRQETCRLFGLESDGIQVIPNFVNLNEYHPCTPECREGLAPPDHKILLHMSNFREVKRVQDVVRIFTRIRRQLPATLLMVGDGPDRELAEHEVREAGVGADVRFLGRLDTVANLLQATDLFVLPSQTESFGLAALEAMACGAPVVTSNAGGLPEIVDDGVNGVTEPPGSVEAMARRAVEMLRSPDRHGDMRRAAIAKSKLFAADLVVPRYEQLYAEMLSQ
jgi:N-acetyl-alpha-D-glucosaminyl L-malate synthase BshA